MSAETLIQTTATTELSVTILKDLMPVAVLKGIKAMVKTAQVSSYFVFH